MEGINQRSVLIHAAYSFFPFIFLDLYSSQCSQDLLSLKYKKPKKIFSSSYLEYDKTHRYLNGENRFNEIHFKCTGKKMAPRSIEIVEYTLLVDKYVETCVNKQYKYINEYDLLSGTTVVMKSKQWISPINRYFLTYNLYALQQF